MRCKHTWLSYVNKITNILKNNYISSCDIDYYHEIHSVCIFEKKNTHEKM